MEKKKQLIMNGIIGIIILILIFIIIKLYPIYNVILLFLLKIILPFVVAAFITYLIYPIRVKIEQLPIHPTIAISLLFILFFGGCIGILYKTIPIFTRELEELSKQLPYLIQQYENMIYHLYDSTAFLPEIFHDKLGTLIYQIETLINRKVNGLLQKILDLPNLIVFIAMIPVLVFYFFKDFPLLKEWCKKLTPVKHHTSYERLLSNMDQELGGYVRGQLTISLIITAVSYLFYYILDIKYAFVLAVFMGVMNIIPYIGPIIGTIPVALIALTSSVKLLVILIIINLSVQLLESTLLSPYIMGKHIQIHPVALIFILLIGAELAGIVGMILAIPITVIIRTVYNHIKGQNLQSN